MRDQKTWETQILPKIIEQFSPRIQHDLRTIPPPDPPNPLVSTYIFGPVGSGKTLEAIHMMIEANRVRWLEAMSRDILFVSVPELIVEIQDSFNTKNITQREILDKYSNAHLLVLDDLGAEKPTEFVITTLYLIINRRYENMLTTVITSNYDYNDLADIIDERIIDRIDRSYLIFEKTAKWKTK